VNKRALIAALVAVGTSAAPTGAHAADLSVGSSCVRAVPGVKSLSVTATGFAAGSYLSVKADGDFIASGTPDPSGNLSLTTYPPSLGLNEWRRTFQLTASDGTTTVGPKSLTVSRVGVHLPHRARPRQRVSYRVHGFPEPGKTVYLFVRRGGKTLRRFSLGRAKGSCGDTSRKLAFMPLKRYRSGTYAYCFSQRSTYSAAATVSRVDVTIYIR
jgi:hypothetical protein